MEARRKTCQRRVYSDTDSSFMGLNINPGKEPLFGPGKGGLDQSSRLASTGLDYLSQATRSRTIQFYSMERKIPTIGLIEMIA